MFLELCAHIVVGLRCDLSSVTQTVYDELIGCQQIMNKNQVEARNLSAPFENIDVCRVSVSRIQLILRVYL